MANIAQLPPELFFRDIQHLCRLSLLSRQWYAALVPRIYAEWTYNGARQSFMSLWNFLRTILSNTHLASLVHSLHIGNWVHYPPYSDEWEELDFLQNEISLLESNIIEDIRKRDRRPLMALLLTCLPNITRIYTHVPQPDPVLHAILRQILNCQSGDSPSAHLSKLSELSVFPEVNIRNPPDYNNRPLLFLSDLWPALKLRSLQTLSLYGLHVGNATYRLGAGPGISRLKYLTIDSFYYKLHYRDLKALLNLLEALTSFSLHVRDNGSCAATDEMISNVDLWKVLQKHKNCLEYLDIYRDTGNRRFSMRYGHFGILRSFTCLKKLFIQAEFLLGYTWDPSDDTCRLQDRLPCNIQSLTLYNTKGFFHTSCMGKHLQEALDKGFYVDSSISEVWSQNGISLSMEQGNYPEFLKKTYGMRLDGQRRSAMYNLLPNEYRGCHEVLLPFDDSMDAYEIDISDEYIDRRAGYLKLRTLDFRAHDGSKACMVFQNIKHSWLPPLFSFPIYFTHAQTSPGKIDYETLYHTLCDNYKNYDVRLDLYFVPGIGEEDCITHYREEGRILHIPTRVHDYSDTCSYRGLLFICTEPEWNGDQGTLWSVQFDPVPHAKDGTKSSDEEEKTPLRCVQRHPVNDSSRSYEGYGGESPIDRWISDIASKYKEELRGAWIKATRRGWESWS
ncbi:hypothetical protein BDV26DRAFT_280219 [Aspergillus bertholletiae]|uniref:Uncharacterized protein n=1 Tax=Aspergillus bertholletiae TaxID=1226010 RepID=A0A5N7BCX1_9EURO|nr:hypothetical protein BDV26DRAFT_280219 [Aspergillus bertholletiae]